jgi:uridylate kinase
VTNSPQRRVLLKMSGEALEGEGDILDGATVDRLAAEIAQAHSDLNVQIAIVIGSGNIWRGRTGVGQGMDQATADYMGMLATAINAMALQDALERHGQPTRVQTAIEMREVAESYVRRRAMRHMEKGRIVILAGGLGSPFFTTDTAAAQRAAEIEADVVLKGTHSGVDGVYDADPKVEPGATRFDEISFQEVIVRDLRVMDSTAITFCRDNKIPIVVFDLMTPGNIRRAIAGEKIGTLVH